MQVDVKVQQSRLRVFRAVVSVLLAPSFSQLKPGKGKGAPKPNALIYIHIYTQHFLTVEH